MSCWTWRSDAASPSPDFQAADTGPAVADAVSVACAAALEMRDAAVRRRLHSFDGGSEFPLDECNQPLHRRFERHAARRPLAVAVRLVDRDVSYGQLNADANRAARVLLHHTQADLTESRARRPIVLLLRQGYASIVWTLAILKSGRSYAPLDQRLPAPVLRQMVARLDPEAVVADPVHLALARDLAPGACAIVDSDDRSRPSAATQVGQTETHANLDVRVDPEAIAYIFHTSGSSGVPKGVCDSHRHVLHNIGRYTTTLAFGTSDVMSLVQNPSFSGTVSTLFGGLLNGAAIAPFNLDGPDGLDGVRGAGLLELSEWLRRARVTIVHAVPSIVRQLRDPVHRFPDVRLVRLEGDRASVRDLDHCRAHFSDACIVVNGLGATECGLVRQFFIDASTTIADSGAVPLGYAVPDTTVHVVDERGARLPPGSVGEIVVESEYLATGYWRDPILTAERFATLEGGRRRYRTGDLGRLDADGCLFHLGRVDHRLRISGEFVDALEIEAAILKVDGVRQCAVADVDNREGERVLCAYLVADREVTVTEVREALSARVAAPLVPSRFVFLDALPLSNDRKIDRRRLPSPGTTRPPLSTALEAPRGELERTLAAHPGDRAVLEALASFHQAAGDTQAVARFTAQLQALNAGDP